MKQRIRTVAAIRRGEEVLLLKRNRGRMDSSPNWELLTGKIKLGEQPEDAISRAAFEGLGVRFKSVKLKDAITFMALAEASRLSNLYIIYEAELDDGAKLIPKDRYTAYKYMKIEDLASLRLDEATKLTLEIEQDKQLHPQRSVYTEVANGATVYVDGSSRGNPGPAGIGYYIVGENGQVLRQGGEFIGFATSRVAEYYALKEGCEQALELGLKSVRFVSDNLMVVNQMNGIYQVKNQDLVPIYRDVQKLVDQFEVCAFVHVKRELNEMADAEANLAIDRHFERDEY